MDRKNKDVRIAAERAGIRMWEIAERMGVADTTLCRRLRRELPEGEKQRVIQIIEELAKEAN